MIVLYSILIVDDEYEIRKGLEAFDWESLGIKMIGSCAHGIEAYQRISSEQINILLTDIRMPFMDGFELIQQVNRHFPYIKTLILTGYNDFSFAQQGIRLGISDYILKPANDSDLIAAFSKVKKDMDANKMVELQRTVLERKAKLTSHLIRKRFMRILLFQSLTQDEIEEGCSESEMILDSDLFVVTLIRIDRKAEQGFYSHEEWKLILFVLENILSEVWDDNEYGYHWIDRMKGYCYLLCTNRDLLLNKDSNNSSFVEIVKQIMDHIKRFSGLLLSTISLGVGPSINQTSQIHLSSIAVTKEIDTNSDKEILISIPNATLNNTELSSYSEFDSDMLVEPSQQRIIIEAKRFIDQNFERSITLQDVAAHVHFNPNYFSSLFRKATGKNYIHFLTDRRIKQAIHLLKHTQYKVYEICEMVGYSTPAYFSDIFRKYTGHHPQEYRSIHKTRGEGET